MIVNRELTEEEQQTVIATVIVSDMTVYYQIGDETKYNSYLAENERLQNVYVNELKTFIQNSL
jgi:hypothetical protein